MEAIDHFELASQVFLGEVIKHSGVYKTLHEGAAVLR